MPANWLTTLVLLALAIVPVATYYAGSIFWIDIFTRLVILALAALSLNLLMGIGGMPSFGHAAFIGIGAYSVGIPAYHATYGGAQWLAGYAGSWHLTVAIATSALFALVTGAISLRTKGVHFIMITMAFSQMMYYTLVSLDEYGADDGLTIDLRSEFGWIDLDNPIQLFALCYVSLLLFLYFFYRVVHSKFGRMLDAIRQNEERTRALGVNPYHYRLVAYVMSGCLCAYAGVLMANYTTFISPSMIEWTRSGELMFMVILGGSAFLFGPLFGAIAFILLEYYLSRWTIFWHLPFGIILIVTVLLFRGGIAGLLYRHTDKGIDR